MRRLRMDPLALVAAVLALVMVVVYLRIMREQSDRPAAWFLAVLVLGAVAAGYGANPVPHRRAALLLAGSVLTAVGVLAILSIGPPILVAGTLCLIAARSRARRGGSGALHPPWMK